MHYRQEPGLASEQATHPWSHWARVGVLLMSMTMDPMSVFAAQSLAEVQLEQKEGQATHV